MGKICIQAIDFLNEMRVENGIIVGIEHMGMTSVVQSLMKWLREIVETTGLRLNVQNAHGLDGDCFDANPHDSRTYCSYFKKYEGIIVLKDADPATGRCHKKSRFLRFSVECTGRNRYEVSVRSPIRSRILSAYKVISAAGIEIPVPIYFTIASTDTNQWIYSAGSVLLAQYDEQDVLTSHVPLLNPSGPSKYMSRSFLEHKLSLYLSGVGRKKRVYFEGGHHAFDEDVLLEPTVFEPLSPPVRPGGAIFVDMIPDYELRRSDLLEFEDEYKDPCACIHIHWYSAAQIEEFKEKIAVEPIPGQEPPRCKNSNKYIKIELTDDALAREKAVDQALYSMLPRVGTIRSSVSKSVHEKFNSNPTQMLWEINERLSTLI